MKNLTILTLLFFCCLIEASGQSFNKRNNRYKRSYMSTAITGAVPIRRAHGPRPDQNSFASPVSSIEKDRDHSQRGLRKFFNRNNREMARVKKSHERERRKRFSDENAVLRNKLSVNQEHTDIGRGR